MDDLSLFRDAGVGGVFLYVVARDMVPLFRRWIDRNSNSDNVPLTDSMPPKNHWRMVVEGRVLMCEKMIEILGNTCEDMKALLREQGERLNEIHTKVEVLISRTERR